MPETFETWAKRRGFETFSTLQTMVDAWFAEGLSAAEINQRAAVKAAQIREHRQLYEQEVPDFPEPLESLYWMREIIVKQLDALKQPFDYPPLQTGMIGLHLYTPEDPVRRLSPELDAQMRKQREADLVSIDDRIAQAEKEWAETPKLTLKCALQGEAAGIVFPAGTEFIREDRIFKRPDGVDIGVLMIRGRPHLAVAAAIDEALKD